MSYVAYSDLFLPDNTVVDLTDDEGLATTDPSSLSDSVSDNPLIQTRIEAEITNAESFVNGYLRKRYSVPVASPPDVLKSITKSIVAFYLYRRRPGIGVPEEVRNDFTDARDYLKGISSGKIDLDIDPTPSESQAVVADVDYEDQLFTADTLKYF